MALFCFFITCANQHVPQHPNKGGFYRKAMPFIQNLDPRYSNSGWNDAILNLFSEPLFKYDSEMKLKPVLVEKWTLDETKRVYYFKLKDNILFHDGHRLISKDVKFSISRLVCNRAKYSGGLLFIEGAKSCLDGSSNEIAGIKIINNSEFKIELTEPFYFLLSILSMPRTSIFPFFESSEQDFFKNPAGTGPFQIETITDKMIRLVRNDNYHDRKAILDGIHIEFLDKDVAIKKFKKGEIEDLDSYRIDEKITGNYKYFFKHLPNTNLLLFNINKGPFNDIHFRKAFVYALNKKFLKGSCATNSKPAFGVIPWGIGGYSEDNKIGFDIKKAKTILEKRPTHEKNMLPMHLFRPEYYNCKDFFSETLSKQMAMVGLNLIVEHVPFNIISSAMKKEDYSIVNLTFISDTDEAFSILYQIANYLNDSIYFKKNVKLKTLLKKVMRTTDQYDRYELYKQIDQIFIQDALVVPLWYGTAESYYQPYVEGIEMSPLTTVMNDMSTIWLSN